MTAIECPIQETVAGCGGERRGADLALLSETRGMSIGLAVGAAEPRMVTEQSVVSRADSPEWSVSPEHFAVAPPRTARRLGRRKSREERVQLRA